MKKVFLDECVTIDLMPHLTGHEVVHISTTPLRGSRNGALLRAVSSNYDVFLTTDRHLPYQQNLKKFPVAVLIMPGVTNNIEDLLPLVPKTLAALDTIKSGDLVIIRA